MIKGDTQLIKIYFTVDCTPTKLGENDELYYTVKKEYDDEFYIFQKSKSDMEYNEEEQCYELCIEPEDTKDIELIDGFTNLYYDLQFVGTYNGKNITKTLDRGTLYLTYDITNR